MKANSRAHRGSSKGAGIIELPASGCDLPVPALPKTRDWSAEERKLWRSLWKSPQATQWDDSYLAAVASYVVYSSHVCSGTATAWVAAEFRQLGNQMGLTAAGLQALGWIITDGI